MKQLTYSEIELLQYTLLCHMRDSGNESSSLKSLYNKLVAIRAQLESFKHKPLFSADELYGTEK
jgi:hypothetical protein